MSLVRGSVACQPPPVPRLNVLWGVVPVDRHGESISNKHPPHSFLPGLIQVSSHLGVTESGNVSSKYTIKTVRKFYKHFLVDLAASMALH